MARILLCDSLAGEPDYRGRLLKAGHDVLVSRSWWLLDKQIRDLEPDAIVFINRIDHGQIENAFDATFEKIVKKVPLVVFENDENGKLKTTHGPYGHPLAETLLGAWWQEIEPVQKNAGNLVWLSGVDPATINPVINMGNKIGLIEVNQGGAAQVEQWFRQMATTIDTTDPEGQAALSTYFEELRADTQLRATLGELAAGFGAIPPGMIEAKDSEPKEQEKLAIGCRKGILFIEELAQKLGITLAAAS